MHEDEGWKVTILQEIIELLQGNMNKFKFEYDELE